MYVRRLGGLQEFAKVWVLIRRACLNGAAKSTIQSWPSASIRCSGCRMQTAFSACWLEPVDCAC